MDLHFRAFSFVDRITSVQKGLRISGQYTVPAQLAAFSNSLVVEATGQLAAWASMSALNFTHRPVAGLARRVELFSAVQPGQVLELVAHIETVDEEAVAYGGNATANGALVVRLHDCVGPMMPLIEFDDPQQVRERFELLQTKGAPPGAFTGVPEVSLKSGILTSDGSVEATCQVPEQADFFADHFPRRPVFPGTLLTQANLILAGEFLDRLSPAPMGRRWVPREIHDVKLRSFIAPGETLALSARQQEIKAETATVKLQISRSGKRIGSCRVVLAVEEDG